MGTVLLSHFDLQGVIHNFGRNEFVQQLARETATNTEKEQGL